MSSRQLIKGKEKGGGEKKKKRKRETTHLQIKSGSE